MAIPPPGAPSDAAAPHPGSGRTAPTTPTTPGTTGAPSWPSGHREVVVGILDDVDAVALVRTALTEAEVQQASVRVVRVLPAGSGRAEVLAADSLAYNVTRAGGRAGGVPTRFEVAVGDPVEVLLDRARGATLLVLGDDREGGTVTRRLEVEADCVVRVVTPH